MTPSLDSFQSLIAEYQNDVFAVALATVSYQALRAALSDPVTSLRYE